jgi:hypothetical protein
MNYFLLSLLYLLALILVMNISLLIFKNFFQKADYHYFGLPEDGDSGLPFLDLPPGIILPDGGTRILMDEKLLKSTPKTQVLVEN